ncbi:MAG: ATP-dependent endonuclease [Bernardetiaceae bacterium]
MSKISYVKIQNFKIFGKEVVINFDNPTILIGANNSGKTSVIQALALWSWAVKIWYDKKGNAKSQAQKNKGVSLNRLEIAQVPIKETRYFWNKASIRQGSHNYIPLTIRVGLLYENEIVEVGINFTYHSSDLIYCQPTPESFADTGLEWIKYAAQLSINLLYPMSGMSDKEFVLQEEAIRTQIGVGQTANVLRNICYHLYINSRGDWEYLTELTKKLFSISLKAPFVRATGVLELFYNYESKEKTIRDLDITLSGRGQQQMLLVLAYLLSNRGSVLMIDEPDAHLEILRQSQIFTILKEVARSYDCQIIIVTHSEVVLNESRSVVFLADGQAQTISENADYKFIKDALKNFGLEHYYKAKLNPHILYVESSTDLDILRAFAKKYQHKASDILTGKLYYYYTQNEASTEDLPDTLERTSGLYKPFRRHFQSIKKIIPELKALALFDGDNKNKQDEQSENFAVLYWTRYEIENYFITPKVIFAFLQKQVRQSHGPLFEQKQWLMFERIFNETFLLPVFNNNRKALDEFRALPENLKDVQFENFASSKKVSALLAHTFQEFASESEQPILLTKGNYYQLIEYTEVLPEEVNDKLDQIVKYLSD